MHRDPCKTIASYAQMIFEVQKFYYGNNANNKIQVANFIKKRFLQMINKGLEIRKKYNLNFTDINYLDLKYNPSEVLKIISPNLSDINSNGNSIKKQVNQLKKLKNIESYTLDEFELDKDNINYRRFVITYHVLVL